MKTPRLLIDRRLHLAALLVALILSACGNETPQAMLESGRQYAAKKDYQAAVIQFKAALQLDPKLTEARRLLGMALLDAGDPAGAAIEFNRALDEKAPVEAVLPPLSRALLLAGEYQKLTSLYGNLNLTDKVAMATLKSNVATAWGALGDRDRTVVAVKAALDAVPDHGPALILNARILAGKREFAQSLVLLDKVLAADPRLHEGWVLKGEIIAATSNDTQAAEQAFAKALEVDRVHVPAYTALIWLRLRQGDLAGARVQADRLRAVLPKHPMTALVDGQLAFLERQFVKARELSQQLIRVFPNNVAVLILAGAVEAELGSLMQAEAHFNKVLQLNPSVWIARRNLAETLIRVGQPAKAIEALKPLLAEPTPRVEILALAGDAELRLGNPAAAETHFARAAKIDPGNERLQIALASTQLGGGDANTAFSQLKNIASKSKETYAEEAIFSARMKRREYDAALQALDEFEKKRPNDAAVQEMRGRVQIARRDFPAARQAFERVLQMDPARFAAVSGLAAVDLLEKEPEQAIARLKAAVTADPRNHYALVGLAELKISTGAPIEEVRSQLVSAIKLAPDDPLPRLMLVDFLLRKRLFKDALAASEEALSALPNDTRILEAVGRVQRDSGDTEQAISTFRRLAENDSRSGMAYMRLAEVYRASGRRPLAEAALRKALEVEPDLALAQLALVELLMSSQREADALRFIRKAQTDRPKHGDGYALEAVYHRRLKAIDKAASAYRTGLARTGSPELARGLYSMLLAEGRLADASQFSAGWLKEHPKDTAFEFLVAGADIQRGDLATAEARLKRVLTDFPENVLAMNNMAWVLTQSGKPGAVAYAQRAVNASPDKAELLDTLAAALLAENQPAKALETQRLAVEIQPTNATLRLSLARIAIKAGDKATARSELERLRALGSNYAQQAEVVKLLQGL